MVIEEEIEEDLKNLHSEEELEVAQEEDLWIEDQKYSSYHTELKVCLLLKVLKIL